MKAKLKKVVVDPTAIDPTLDLAVHVSFEDNTEAPVYISGRLLSKEGKIIAKLEERYTYGHEPITLRYLSENNKNKNYRESRYTTHHYHLTAPLSPNAINYIEKLREEHPEKAVEITVNLLVRYISMPTFSQNHQRDTLHLKEEDIHVEQHKIVQSDWLRNYAPKLGIGKFLLLELEVPKNLEIFPDWQELHNYLSIRLEQMEKSLAAGDWQQVMQTSRQFFENAKLKKLRSEELKKLFLDDQHEEEGFKKFNQGIYNFFDYTSKFIHDRGIDKEFNSRPIPHKEDAYFIYAMAVALFNVICRKIGRRDSN